MNETYQTYRYQGHILPVSGSARPYLSLDHVIHLAPDKALHVHPAAEAAFLLLNGRLEFAVDNFLITLQPGEILLIRPGTLHAIVGGEGQVEYFGIQAPAVNDRLERGPLPRSLKPAYEDDRLALGEWGQRTPLFPLQHLKTWLASAGKVFSHCLNLGYFSLPTAGNHLQAYHQLPFEQELWVYYLVFQGRKTLQIGQELITVGTGKLLEVPPRVKPILHNYDPPCRGIIISVPAHSGDEI